MRKFGGIILAFAALLLAYNTTQAQQMRVKKRVSTEEGGQGTTITLKLVHGEGSEAKVIEKTYNSMDELLNDPELKALSLEITEGKHGAMFKSTDGTPLKVNLNINSTELEGTEGVNMMFHGENEYDMVVVHGEDGNHFEFKTDEGHNINVLKQDDGTVKIQWLDEEGNIVREEVREAGQEIKYRTKVLVLEDDTDHSNVFIQEGGEEEVNIEVEKLEDGTVKVTRLDAEGNVVSEEVMDAETLKKHHHMIMKHHEGHGNGEHIFIHKEHVDGEGEEIRIKVEAQEDGTMKVQYLDEEGNVTEEEVLPAEEFKKRHHEMMIKRHGAEGTGQRVIRLKANGEGGVFIGEEGEVVEVAPDKPVFWIQANGETIKIKGDQLNEVVTDDIEEMVVIRKGHDNEYSYLIDDEEGDLHVIIKVATIEIEEVKEEELVHLREELGLEEGMELELAELNTYPNPTEGVFTLDFTSESKKPVQLRVFDLEGREVLNQTLKGRKGKFSQKVDLSGEAAGIYIIALTQEGKTMTRKVIIENK